MHDFSAARITRLLNAVFSKVEDVEKLRLHLLDVLKYAFRCARLITAIPDCTFLRMVAAFGNCICFYLFFLLVNHSLTTARVLQSLDRFMEKNAGKYMDSALYGLADEVQSEQLDIILPFIWLSLSDVDFVCVCPGDGRRNSLQPSSLCRRGN